MPEAAIPLVAEEAVGATAAELAAQQAAQMAAAQAAAEAAAQAAAEQAAQQAAAEQAAQAATEQATTGGISDLVQPTTAPVNPAAPVQTAPLAQAGPAIPPTAPVQSTPLQPPPGTPPAAPPPAAPPPPTAPAVEPPPAQPSFNYNQTANFPEVQSPRITSFQPPSTAGLGGAPSAYPLGTGAETDAGIQALAKEVGAQSTMPGVDTTLTQYASGAPGSSALPPMAGPPAPGINQLVQPNLAGMGSNMPPAPPFANQTMIPNTPVSVTGSPSVPRVESLAQGLDPASQQVGNTTLENYQTQQLYPNANVSENAFDPRVSQAQGLQAKDFAGNSVEGLTQRPAGTSTGLQTSTNPFTYNGPEAAPKLGYALNSTIDPTAVSANAPTSPAGGLQGLWQDFKGMSLKDKALTGMMASSAYQTLNQPKPYEKPKYKSTFNRDLYSGYNPTPPTPYTPQYAGGGWAAILPAVQKDLEKIGLVKHKSSFDPSKYTASNVEPPTPYKPQYAHGGLADLGGYSDGGRMLKGPGDGMSDDIPATIANKQPARLANEEFVIPADVVSHLGNGSSEAGAKVLYKMMDRVRQARTGSKKQGKQINPEKYLA